MTGLSAYAGGQARQANFGGDNYAPIIFAGGPVPAPSLHQLPPGIYDFSGRVADIAEIERMARSSGGGPCIVNIFGAPGILDFRELSGEGRCVFPGQPEDGDFLGCWLVRARCLKSGGYDDAAELGGHVGGGGFGLAGVPGGGRAAFVQVGGVVAGGNGGAPGRCPAREGVRAAGR